MTVRRVTITVARMKHDAELPMLGSAEHRRVFAEAFDGHLARRTHGADESRSSRQTQ